MDSYRFSKDTIVIRAELKGRPHIRAKKYEEVKNGQGDSLELHSEPFEVKSITGVVTPRAVVAKKISEIKTPSDKYDDQAHVQRIIPERQVTDTEESKTFTKLNPDAKEFVSKSIDWHKLPLKPKDSPVLESIDFEASILNITDRLAGFTSNDGRFTVPRLAPPLPLPETARISSVVPSTYAYPRNRNESFGFRDNYITENKPTEKTDRLRQKNEFPGKQCYHCGNLGHMAVDCSRRKLGFDAVCFTCQETGHIASVCPNDPKIQQEKDENLPIQIQKQQHSDHKAYPTAQVLVPSSRPKNKPTRSSSHNNKLVERKRAKNNRLTQVSPNKPRRTKDVTNMLYPAGMKVQDTHNGIFSSESSPSKLRYASDCSSKSPSSPWANNINCNDNSADNMYVLEDIEGNKFQRATPSDVDSNEIDESKFKKTVSKKDDQIIPLPEALANVLLSNFQMEVVRVRVDKSLNHYLAKHVYVQLNSPPYNTAKIDGWAINDTEKAKSYEYIGMIQSGSDPISIASSSRKTIYIEAGSPIPNGFNCIIPVDQAVRNGNLVTFKNTDEVVKGINIRSVGSDLRKGSLLFQKNKFIGAVEFGLMLSAGICEVEVYQKPSIAVLSSSDEVIWDTKLSNAECHRDRNGHVIEAMIKDCGCEIVVREFIQDKPDILAAKMNSNIKCDMIILVGSISRAIKEYKSYWRSAGSVLFSKGEPDKPASFALLKDHKSGKDKVIFGLSGNPCNIIIALHLFVQPVLKLMMSSSAVKHEALRVVLGEDVCLNPNQSSYEFVNFQKTGGEVSVKLRREPEFSLDRAQAILHIPKASKVKSYLLEGTVVDVLPCGEIDPSLLSIILERNTATAGEVHKTRNKSNTPNMPVSVGIITLSDSAKQKSSAITSMVHQLFSCSADCSNKVTTKNSPQLLPILLDWTRGKNAKQLVFTVGGVGHKDKIHVSSVTQSLSQRELHGVAEKMFKDYKGEVSDFLSYRGTVGICNKTLIVNLPEKEVVAKHCLKQLQFVVEAIINSLKDESR